MIERPPTDDSIVAFHEAGHAVAAYILRRSITRISIAGGAGHGGIVSVTDLAPNQLKRRERDAVIALAGVVAERKHRSGVHGGPSAADDIRQVRELLQDIVNRRGEDPERVLKPRMQAALDEAKRIVEEHWPAIDSLAQELLSRRTLSGKAVRKLLRESIETAS